MKKIESFNITEMYQEVVETLAQSHVKYFEDTMSEKVLEEQYETDEFISHQNQLWGKAFIAYESMYYLAIESAILYGQHLEKKNQNTDSERANQYPIKFIVLRELHGRACQIYLEILCLIKNGFADGAFARWRSMYELDVTSSFILENEGNVAKAYYESMNKDNNRNDWAKQAKCFQTKEYKNKIITFADLQKHTCFSINPIWKQQYELGNIIVHASPQGTFKRLANGITDKNFIPVGRSNYGVNIPAENSVISLARMTIGFLSIYPYEEGLIQMKCISLWIDIVRKYLTQVDELFSNNGEVEINFRS